MKIYTLHFDGSCGPTNPGGTAAFGYALSFENEVITGNGIIGTGPLMSNNLAEFTALMRGLECAQRYAVKGDHINVRGDSQLVVNIMSRRWKATRISGYPAARAYGKDNLYWPAYIGASEALAGLRRSGVVVGFDWIPRELNTLCNDLSKDYVKVT